MKRSPQTRFPAPSLACIAIAILLLPSCSKKASDAITPGGNNLSVTITSYRPTLAGAGDTVTIFGTNLPTDLSKEKITINSRPVSIIFSSPDSLKIVVPNLLGSGQIVLSIGTEVCNGPTFTYQFHAIVTTIAGNGSVGNDDGAAGQASFNCPWGITADNNGDLYVADCYNRLIRKVSAATGQVSSIQIPVLLDTSRFYSPYNLALDKSTHNLYVTDFNAHVLKIDGGGAQSVIYSDSMAVAGIALGPDGLLYMANNTLGTLFRMDTSGHGRTFLNFDMITPRNIVFDGSGNMYVSAFSLQLGASAIFERDPAGQGNTVAKDPTFQGWEIAVDSAGNFYEADHFANQIRMIERSSGASFIIAGSGNPVDEDGTGLEASFNGPQGLTIDAKGNLYVTTYNYNTSGGNKIRKITLK